MKRESSSPQPEPRPICDNCKRRLSKADRAIQRGFTAVIGTYKSQSLAPYFTLCRRCAQVLPELPNPNSPTRANKIYWAYKDKAPDYAKGD